MIIQSSNALCVAKRAGSEQCDCDFSLRQSGLEAPVVKVVVKVAITGHELEVIHEVLIIHNV